MSTWGHLFYEFTEQKTESPIPEMKYITMYLNIYKVYIINILYIKYNILYILELFCENS